MEKEGTMPGELYYLAANEHAADLRRAAERERLGARARAGRHPSLLARVVAHLRHGDQRIAEQATVRRVEPRPAGRSDEAAVAET
jgi:hypothetical protein